MPAKPRLTITAKQRAGLLRLWVAAAEHRSKASDIEGLIAQALDLDDAGNVIVELEAGASTVADFDRVLAANGVVVAK